MTAMKVTRGMGHPDTVSSSQPLTVYTQLRIRQWKILFMPYDGMFGTSGQRFVTDLANQFNELAGTIQVPLIPYIHGTDNGVCTLAVMASCTLIVKG
jgi:hypothetical protein